MFVLPQVKPKSATSATHAETLANPARSPVPASSGLFGSAHAAQDFFGIPVDTALPTPSGSQFAPFPAKPPQAHSNDLRASVDTKNDLPAVVQDVLRSPGKPLDSADRSYFESRLRFDFSQVRVHNDGPAAESTRAVGALAYTAGNHVVLGSDQSLRGTAKSKRLIAHELTHVVQQRSVKDNTPTRIGPAGDAFEAEADAVADRIQSDPTMSSPEIAMRTDHPVVQRALPVAAEVLEIVLTGVIVGQEAAAANQGRLLVEFAAASRRGDPPQAKDRENRARVLTISRNNAILPNVHAFLDVRWQSNDFGEIGAAVIEVADSTQFSKSSLNVEFKPLDNLPEKGQDIRAWPIQWIYTGNFDPIGSGDFDFRGKFEIDAFGGFRSLEHVVEDRSLIDKGPDFVRRGQDIPSHINPLPPGVSVTTQPSAKKAPAQQNQPAPAAPSAPPKSKK
jgi:Domain of unknown function (DUF4157)